MAKEMLSQKERWYADSHKEAEEIVADAKQDEALTMQKIHEKHNSKGFYYLVDLERTYSTAKEEMDNRPEKNDVPEGQMSLDEGIEYNVEKDGSVSVIDGPSTDDEEEDIEFVEDESEDIEVPETSPFEEDGEELPF